MKPIGQLRHLRRCVLRGGARIADAAQRKVVRRIAVVPIQRAGAPAPFQPLLVAGLGVEEHEGVRVQAAVLDPGLSARLLILGLAPARMAVEQRRGVVRIEVVAEGRDFLARGFRIGLPQQIPRRGPFEQFVVLAFGGNLVAEKVIVQMLAPSQGAGSGAGRQIEIGVHVVSRGPAVTGVARQGAQEMEDAQGHDVVIKVGAAHCAVALPNSAGCAHVRLRDREIARVDDPRPHRRVPGPVNVQALFEDRAGALAHRCLVAGRRQGGRSEDKRS